MPRLVLATGNIGKRRELEAMLPPDSSWEVLTLEDFPSAPEVVEDGATFEENARKKAVALAEHTGCWSLADDSGLEVDALGGRPGVLSARYAPGDDAARNRKLLEEMKTESERSARFVCVLCLASPGGEEVVFTRGECAGEIAAEARGAGGFGYDPVFFVPELGKTFGESTAEEKHARSHRGAALRALLPELQRHAKAAMH